MFSYVQLVYECHQHELTIAVHSYIMHYHAIFLPSVAMYIVMLRDVERTRPGHHLVSNSPWMLRDGTHVLHLASLLVKAGQGGKSPFSG